MNAHPHLLYAGVTVHRPKIQIRLYRDDCLVSVFGADQLTRDELETGVLHQACLHAGVSMADDKALRRYRAEAEGGIKLHVVYDREELEFYTKSQ